MQHLLSPNIRAHLEVQGYLHLNQIIDPIHTTIWRQGWLSRNMLGLLAQEILEWVRFTQALEKSHIHLQDRLDELLWVGDPSGMYTQKTGYIRLCIDLFNREEKWWWRKVWMLRCLTKSRLLVWMNIENKTPTWDILQKQNHHGSRRCSLCKAKSKTINHIFITCNFTKFIWMELARMYVKHFNWSGKTLNKHF